MQPRVTILIANRNYGRYIGDTIQSALEQSYKDINIAIVDDGSTDDSWQVIHNKLFKENPHTKLSLEGGVEAKVGTVGSVNLWAVKLPNTEGVGPSAARNYAIDRWINQSFAFQVLDADDIMAPNKVEKLLKKMLQAPGKIGVVYADYDNLNVETGQLVREYKEPFDISRLFAECIVHSGAMINSVAFASIQQNGQYYRNDFRTAEDWQLWLMIAQHFMIVHIAESLTTVRIHKQNSTNTAGMAVWDENWNKIRQYLAGHRT